MLSVLLTLLTNMLIISLSSFGGGATALFYQFGVQQTHWITSNDLSAILAFGYATPGPAVFGIGAFIGYRVAGFIGAVVGAIGIFFAPWFLSMIAAKHFSGWLAKAHAQYFIKAIGLAAAGVVGATAIKLMPPHSSTNIVYIVIAILSFVVITKWKVSPLYILLVCGLLSIFIH